MTDQENEIMLKYLDGTLDGNEQEIFDQLMKDSPLFKKEVENAELIVASLKVTDRMGRYQVAKNLFKELDQENDQTNGRSIRLNNYWFTGMAAAMVLLIVSYFLFFDNHTEVTPQALYAEYFEPIPLAENVTRNSGTSLNEGLSLYSKGQYQLAIPLLEKATENNSINSNKLYLASAYLENNQPSKGELLLEGISLENLSGTDKRNLLWYLSLAQLAQDKVDLAKENLQVLAVENGFYQKEANEILQALDE